VTWLGWQAGAWPWLSWPELASRRLAMTPRQHVELSQKKKTPACKIFYAK